MTFARADAARVPERWRRVGDRRSALSATSPRNATTSAQACLNYGYALGEFACRIALQANGLDPDIGWLHCDAPYRASAALDLLEVLRPSVDRFLLEASPA
jgi:CRISPR-associated protein Cas1